MKVTVGALHGEFPAFESPFPNQGFEVPWEERPKVELEVGDDEPLGSVLERAMDELGVRSALPEGPQGRFGHAHEIAFVGFHRPEDSSAVRSRQYYNLAAVDTEGRARWTNDILAVPFGDVRRAAEAGLIRGDPQLIYLNLTAQGGNGGLLSWPELVMAFALLRAVIATVSDVEGTIAFGKRLLGRTKEAEEALADTYVSLEERGALPFEFREALGQGPWNPADLAELLDCTEDRAKGILQGYGFAEAESGLWRLGVDPEAKLLEQMLDEVNYCRSGDLSDAPAVAFRNRLTESVRSGEPPTLPDDWKIPPLWEAPSEAEAAKQSEELDAMVDHIDDDFEPFSEEDDLASERGLNQPLDQIILKCRCGEPDCSARLEFVADGENLRLVLSGVEDHFVVQAEFLADIALEVSEQHDLHKDRSPGDDDEPGEQSA